MLILPVIMCGGGLRGAEVALHSTRPFPPDCRPSITANAADVL